MNKNIFFLLIVPAFSAFDEVQASSVKHQKVQEMKSIEQLRDARDAQRLEDVIKESDLSFPGLAPFGAGRIEYFKKSFIDFRKKHDPSFFYASTFYVARESVSKK